MQRNAQGKHVLAKTFSKMAAAPLKKGGKGRGDAVTAEAQPDATGTGKAASKGPRARLRQLRALHEDGLLDDASYASMMRAVRAAGRNRERPAPDTLPRLRAQGFVSPGTQCVRASARTRTRTASAP